ncbi:MAG TPA: hypothetical protein PKE40_11600 [Arachnia sp.]|nr:hypothetical protein [Arachnia sp.]HMT86989.1 hypothetical protein [Arachnia sp.]
MDDITPTSTTSRRAVLGTAWAVPVIAAATAVPLAAATTEPELPIDAHMSIQTLTQLVPFPFPPAAASEVTASLNVRMNPPLQSGTIVFTVELTAPGQPTQTLNLTHNWTSPGTVAKPFTFTGIVAGSNLTYTATITAAVGTVYSFLDGGTLVNGNWPIEVQGVVDGGGNPLKSVSITIP